MRSGAIRLLGAAALVLAGCAGVGQTAGAPDQLASADMVDGRTLAERYCAACHSLGPDGKSPHADAPAFRNLSADYPVASLEEALVEGIIVGHPDMPEFRFEPNDAAALVAFLEHVQTDPLQAQP